MALGGDGGRGSGGGAGGGGGGDSTVSGGRRRVEGEGREGELAGGREESWEATRSYAAGLAATGITPICLFLTVSTTVLS